MTQDNIHSLLNRFEKLQAQLQAHRTILCKLSFLEFASLVPL